MQPAGRTRLVLVAAFLLASSAALAGCTRSRPAAAGPSPAAANVVDITVLQMNDVYEMTPVDGGAQGGLARVATLRKQLLAQNPNTYTILAGDLLSPSAIGTASVNGQPLAGQQMVDTMNALGLNYATFGNHEFDLKEPVLQQRLSESKFRWISSNVTQSNGQPFAGVPSEVTFTATNRAGRTVVVGLFGVTTKENPVPYVQYQDAIPAAKAEVAKLRPQVDVLIAITHQSVADDVALVQQVPGIDLVLGGHEHQNFDLQRGSGFTPITKADANDRTVWVHQLSYDTATRHLGIQSTLRQITPATPDDPTVSATVDRWLKAAFAAFSTQGFDPTATVADVTETLDGTDETVRSGSTRLTDVIAAGMLRAAPGTQVAVFNSGSIRIDDALPPGELTQYDILRVLPFGDNVVSASMTGSLLLKVLNQGRANTGTGGFLQTAGVTATAGGWSIDGTPIDPAKTYPVAINDFLLTGKEANLGYLTAQNPGITNLSMHGDLRLALIAELQGTYPS